jgi:2',3'-cyclic-nucleotide 2'-phosphodiesterase (5'-nucleotidase family)
MLKIIYICFIGAGLFACSSVSNISVHPTLVKIDQTYSSNSRLDSLILPFKDSLAKEMDIIIGSSPINFTLQRPNGTMNNWFADAVFVNQTENVRISEPVFCLFNAGGVRTSFNKGIITIGDVFKVMPFDNEIVWVKLPISAVKDIEEYLIKSGGEPIANAQMKNKKLTINGVNDQSKFLWVITSDYLMNGGDRMNFFSQKVSVNTTNKLVRTALIEEVKKQQLLKVNDSSRISFEND